MAGKPQKFKKKELEDLRLQGKKKLLKQLDDLKKELHGLRVTQVAGGANDKISHIHNVRKNIARIATIITQVTKVKKYFAIFLFFLTSRKYAIRIQ